MNGDERERAVVKPVRLAAHLADGDAASEQAACTGRAKGDHNGRLDDTPLLLKPPFAAVDLVGVRALVQPALATHLVLEMLDRIGDEHARAVDAGLLQRLIKDAPRRPDEGLAGNVFFVARLFA